MRLFSCLVLLALTITGLQAQEENIRRVYTPEHPLVYEGAEDLWPYSFLNEQGKPDGFNIELIKLLLGKLNIPYEIHMVPRMKALEDLKAGKSDLMIELTAGFHAKYGYYSANPVTLFTQSILSPKSRPTKVHNFRDLAFHKVFVSDSSLCHHLMIDYGWEKNAITTKNIPETIMKMSTDEEGELVWNTLSLKWMLRKYQIENLEITSVDMPHGEYKFISNDERLVNRLDSLYTALSSSDRLLPLQNKWFYPERNKEKGVSPWVWYGGLGTAILLLILLIYTIIYQWRAGRIKQANHRKNLQLALVLETSNVRIWTYEVDTARFAWRNEKGKVAFTYTEEQFSHRYPDEDFNRLIGAINELSVNRKKDNEPEPEITLTLKARDTEDGDSEMRDFLVTISVLQRDSHKRPIELIGTKVDVTDKNRQQQKTQIEQQLDEEQKVLKQYSTIIDNVLNKSDIRFVSYSADTHVLTIYKNSTEVQHTLSQTRCISLVDERSKKQALRLIAQMDERQDKDINTQILTTLRVKGGLRLNIAFLLTPKKDKNGRVTDYIGICRDYSELYHIDQRYAEGLAKVQEVENTKTSFVENMVQEIQKPMHTVVDYVSRLHPTTASADEPILTQGILDNADYLLHLIENILFLSRLDAHMVEIKTKETEFAKYFGQQCEEGWAKYRNENTRYIVDNPYEELTLVIDSEHVGLIIRQLTANAAQYTVTGAVRARCEYIGRRLIISVDDTGEGIPQEKLEQLNHSNNASRITTDTKGLGLAICQELLEQMNGNIEFSSEKGSGTTVYITIPCQATTIKRKR